MPNGTILLGFREFASAECVSLSTRVTRVNQHPVDFRYVPPNRCSKR